MLLSEFRKLINATYQRGVDMRDELTKYLTPSEYFAYDVVKQIQEDLDMRIDILQQHIEDENLDDDTAMYCLTDHKEFIDAYLSGDIRVMEDPETPPAIKMEIEVDK